MADLLDAIQWQGVECLNQKDPHVIGNALKQGYREDAGLYLESDTDEQLLIHIPFNNAVKISGLTIASKNKPDQAPRHVRLFINRPTIGFTEAAEETAAQEFELTPEDLQGGTPLVLRLVKFQRVNWLTLFVADNQGDEESTVIERIVLHGSAGDSFNVADIKDISKQEG